MQVKATRDFQSANYGSRAKDETFDYPVTEDPDRLLADGFVERVGGSGAGSGAGGGKTEKEG